MTLPLTSEVISRVIPSLEPPHFLLKLSKSISQYVRSHTNPYKAENIASFLSSELIAQLQDLNWFTCDSLLKDELKRLIAYLLFTTFLDASYFQVASEVEFNKTDYIYDVCCVLFLISLDVSSFDTFISSHLFVLHLVDVTLE